jgi:hypothetical protein
MRGGRFALLRKHTINEQFPAVGTLVCACGSAAGKKKKKWRWAFFFLFLAGLVDGEEGFKLLRCSEQETRRGAAAAGAGAARARRAAGGAPAVSMTVSSDRVS